MKKTQHGFMLVEGLLVVLILLVIGFGGYYVWHNQKHANNSSTTSSATAPTPSTSQSSAIKPTQNYLTIKEWGVKVKLSSTDAGAYYKVSDQSPTDSNGVPSQLTVYSSETDALTGPKGISCKGEYIAYLLRAPVTSSDWSDPLTQGYYPNPIQIGSEKYAASSAKQYGPGCWQAKDSTDGNYVSDPATENAFRTIANQFVEDFKSVQNQ